MLTIRLQRTGKKNEQHFRVAVMEKTRSAKGKAMEIVGFLNPRKKERAFKKERIVHWISKGAQPSDTVHNLLVSNKVIEGKKMRAWTPKKPAKGAAHASGGKAEPKQIDK